MEVDSTIEAMRKRFERWREYYHPMTFEEWLKRAMEYLQKCHMK